MLLRTFSTREKEPMLRMFNTYIKSKLEYCCIVWSPLQQTWIYKLEQIQNIFTSKINGMEELNNHERLKKNKHVQLRKEKSALHDNIWLTTTRGNQRKHTETRCKVDKKRKNNNTSKQLVNEYQE